MRDETIRHCLRGAKLVAKGLLLGAVSIGCLPEPLAGADSQIARKTLVASVTLDSTATILLGADEPLSNCGSSSRPQK
jgi:hypothetical protein